MSSIRRYCRSKFVLLLLVIAPLLTPAFCQDVDQKIEVMSTSNANTIITVNAELETKSIEMTCFESNPECRVPKPGFYLMNRLPAGKGFYMDCANVDLFSISRTGQHDKRLGQYCLHATEGST
jgi:hypothetical protein